MADYKHIVPFVLKSEGGYVNDPNDAGGETNKGVTYTVWKSVFGDTHDRFMAMSDEDWGQIFKKNYWDLVCGDQINSQRIADLLADWAYNAGRRTPSIDVQDILNHSFAQHLTEDGQLGSSSIAAINAVDENTLFNDIVQKRLWFYDQCVASHPSNAKYIVGWRNRVHALVAFEQSA
jgi:lysozyme family protein